MTIPRDYDTWRQQGPDEPDEPKMIPCPVCTGFHRAARWICDECDGTGEVPFDAEEYENGRGDWLLQRRKDEEIDPR